MKASAIPTKYPEAWAAQAAAGFIRAIPETTSDPNAASLDLGFPPNTFTPVGAGGAPPDGRDANGILNQETSWSQWFSAGAPVAWDLAFSAAIGGYPEGALIATTSPTPLAARWLSTVDDNVTNPDTGGAGWTLVYLTSGNQTPTGQCALGYVDANTLSLMPKNGSNIIINGKNYQVPAGGVTLPPTALTPGAAYYVYAHDDGSGDIALEASPTGHVTDTTVGNVGIEIKAGDPTRSLVGLWLIIAGPAWSGVSGQGRSWFNDTTQAIFGASTAGATVNVTSYTHINAAADVTFLAWANDAISVSATGLASSSNGNSPEFLSIRLDGTQVGSEGAAVYSTQGFKTSITAAYGGRLTEGVHTLSMWGKVGSATATYDVFLFGTVST